ncbi:MAG: helix-turn-helix domain-containing protein [Bdellovibrionales bacterium]|nr:helix-turn-helix domain-containing protein [Bdellovibrionales bacterium]
MEKQLSFEFQILSSGKQQYSSLKKHLSSKKDKKPKQKLEEGKKQNLQALVEKDRQTDRKSREKQPIRELLPKIKEEFKLKTLSLEGVKTEDTLKETSPDVHSPKKEMLFENLVSVETVAEGLRIAPKTIHNWVYLRKIPYVKCGQKVMFRPKSLKAWLNRKEIKSWL